MKAIVSKGKYEIALSEKDRRELAKEETTISCIIRFLGTMPLVEKMLFVKSRSKGMIAATRHQFGDKGFYYSDDYALCKPGESNIQIIITPEAIKTFEKSTECFRLNFKNDTHCIFSKEEAFIGGQVVERYEKALPV